MAGEPMPDEDRREQPERIYLEPGWHDNGEGFRQRDWCEDKIEDDWIEYVRADLLDRLEGEPVAWVDQRGDSDCWIACIASLAGVPVDDFPQPADSDDDDAWMEYGNRVRRFLIERGWLLLSTWQHVPAGYAIAGGDSPRNQKWGHAVVTCDGETVHDPHPSRDGLASEVEEYEVLIPLARRTHQTPEDP